MDKFFTQKKPFAWVCWWETEFSIHRRHEMYIEGEYHSTMGDDGHYHQVSAEEAARSAVEYESQSPHCKSGFFPLYKD